VNIIEFYKDIKVNLGSSVNEKLKLKYSARKKVPNSFSYENVPPTLLKSGTKLNGKGRIGFSVSEV